MPGLLRVWRDTVDVTEPGDEFRRYRPGRWHCRLGWLPIPRAAFKILLRRRLGVILAAGLGLVLILPNPACAHRADAAPAPFLVPPAARQWQRAIIGDARYYFGLDVDYSVFFAQIAQESGWKATAASRFASGLSQFTPATAAGMQRGYARDLAAFCADASGCPLSPRWAIRAQVIYDRDLWRQYAFAASADDRWALTLAAYNGGAGWIARERRWCQISSGCDPARYFGTGVQAACGKSTPARADWACRENTHYPHVILFRWRPGYRAWLDRS